MIESFVLLMVNVGAFIEVLFTFLIVGLGELLT